ncbi:YggT family protein [Desulfosporosinus youngiae]|uniref:YGGT family protein n=1 Tax=Desulfosporosinus youngiae DSM 17734 TaxID=768710 RepID=H5XS19_9FIRM|nr:YggT family protein [Desulfosporosinus youngiae]EHQ87631.1 YGGT family protein [Desulfosporosinus youngiae DSM 17734]
MNEITDPKTHQQTLKAKNIVYYILGVLEVLLAFRLVFKLLGANPQSPFVSFIYSVSQAFLAPFNGIFRAAVTKGIEAQSVLEPTTIIAMIVYAVLAWGIVKLIEISRPHQTTGIH